MTNQHCIETESDAAGTYAIFGFDSAGNANPVKVECDEFVMNNAELDYALIKCNMKTKVRAVILSKSKNVDKASQGIYVLHQNCDYYSDRRCKEYKKISYGNAKYSVGGWDRIFWQELGPHFVHTADTLGGSSGSPIFSQKTNRVVALHNIGVDIDGVRDGRGMENRSVPMAEIVADIQSRKPVVYAKLRVR